MPVFENLESRLTLDASQYKREMGDAAAATESLQKRASKVGDRMQDVGTKMTMGVTGPLAAVGAASLKTASDVEEMQSKMSVVFGEQTGAIQEWARKQEEATGQTELAWQQYATKLGDTFVPMGFAREEATKMSKRVSELAVDLASFNNMPTTESLDRLQGGLVGNHENLREFGVMITQASLGDKLEEMFGKGVQAASEQEKMLARLQIVQESTTDAQGDAARTADSFANRMRALKGQLREAAVVIGNALMPVMKPLVDWLNRAVQQFASLDERAQKIIVIFGGIAAALGPLLVAVGALIGPLTAGVGAFSSLFAAITPTLGILGPLVGLLNPVTLAIGGLVAAAAGIGLLFTDEFGQVRQIIGQVAQKIRTALGQAITWLQTTGVPMAVQAAKRLANMFVQGLGRLAELLPPVMRRAMAALVTWIQTSGIPLARQGTASLVDAVGTAFGVVQERLPPLLARALDALTTWITSTGIPLAMRAFGQLADMAATAFETLQATLPPLVRRGITAVVNWTLTTGVPLAMKGFAALVDASLRVFDRLVELLPPAIRRGVTALVTWVRTSGIPLARQAFTQYTGAITDVVGLLAQKLPPLINQAVGAIVQWLRTEGVSRAKVAFGMLTDAAGEAFRILKQNLPPLVRQGVTAVVTWVQNNGPGLVKRAFDLVATAAEDVFSLLKQNLPPLVTDAVNAIATWVRTNGPGLLKRAFKLIGQGIRATLLTFFGAAGQIPGLIKDGIGVVLTYLRNDAVGDLKTAAGVAMDALVEGADLALQALTPPDGIITQVIGDIASFLINQGPGIVSNAIGFVIDAIMSAFEGLYQGLIGSSLVPELFTSIKAYLINTAVGLVESGIQAVVDGVKTVFENWADWVIGGSGFIQTTVGDITDWLTSSGTEAFDKAFTGIWDAVEGVFESGKEAALGVIDDLVGGLEEKINDAIEWMKETFNAVVPEYIEIPSMTIGGDTIDAGPLGKHRIGSVTIGGGELGPLPQLDSGGIIEREGVYVGHAGERILTPAETRQYNRDRDRSGGDTYAFEFGDIVVNNPEDAEDVVDEVFDELQRRKRLKLPR